MSAILESNDDKYIKTFLRIKPRLKNYESEINYLKISENNRCISLSLSQDNESKFSFENIFKENESQSNIFNIIGKPLCCNVLEGINSTLISYGKKGTGKTYTILGKSIHEIQKESQLNGNETNVLYTEYLNNRGIFNFSLEYIFNKIYLNESHSDYEYNIELSFLEIFDNCVFDYFNILNFDDKNQINLDNLFNNKNLPNLNFNKLTISSPDEAFVLLNKAQKIRNYIFNEINLNEGNGNIIITIYLEKINKIENQIFKSELNFVEISSNFNFNKNKYNISIKRSLETFSYIINQLSDDVKRENIAYENSILTNVMKESLGGNAKTSVLINISSDNNKIIESFQSISFASKMKNIKNNPKINEIIPDNINYSYYKEIIDKNERLKSERNYLLNYLANVNVNMMEKNIENVTKRIAINNNNISKKDKEEDLKKLAGDIDRMNLKIENIEDDIQIMKREKKINLDKYNKVNISLFIQNKEIEEQNKQLNRCMDSKKDKEKLINQYTKDNINLDSEILKQDLKIKELNLRKEEENVKLDKEISINKLQIENKDIILNNLKGINNNLKEENEHKIKIKNQFEIIKAELDGEKTEKTQKIEELKKEQNKKLNKSKKIEQEILNKNSLFNNFQKNLNQYNEYENITINYFKKFYDENSKKEIQNNNKFFDIQKYIPEKEKELKQVCSDIDNINKKKIKCFEEQENIKEEINNKEQISKNLEQENITYNNQINNLNNKISILTTNINFANNNPESKEEIETFKDKNTDLYSSIISYELSSNNNNEPNDLLLFKNNFNVNLDETNKEQLLENKKKLLEQEQNENIILKEKKNMINNEIYKFKINQLKVGNNKDKTHSQYNLVKIEENIDKINEKEKILTNYQNYINENFNIIQNYLGENNPNSNNDNNTFQLKNFKNVFSKFIEKANEIDAEFELIKKEFKEREEEYRRTNKEVVNESLKTYPLLKNYEEIFSKEENDSISNLKNKSDNNHKRITMIDNKILNDVKNLSIYNGIYSKRNNPNSYLNTIPENEGKSSKKRIIPLTQSQSENKNENIFMYRNNKSKGMNVINSNNEKENKNGYKRNDTNFKTQFVNKKRNIKYLYKSPDKIPYVTKKNYKYNNKSNYISNSKAFPNLGKN